MRSARDGRTTGARPRTGSGSTGSQVTLARMREFGIRPDRDLGQNFLVDDNVLGVAGRLLPLVIHTRAADDETFAMLEAARVPVVLHCFGSVERLDDALERGYLVSFAGNVAYPKAEDLREAARRVPDDRILAETDAPYLAPPPHRGRPNQPAYVMRTLEVLAAERGVEPAVLEAQIDANATRVFGL